MNHGYKWFAEYGGGGAGLACRGGMPRPDLVPPRCHGRYRRNNARGLPEERWPSAWVFFTFEVGLFGGGHGCSPKFFHRRVI